MLSQFILASYNSIAINSFNFYFSFLYSNAIIDYNRILFMCISDIICNNSQPIDLFALETKFTFLIPKSQKRSSIRIFKFLIEIPSLFLTSFDLEIRDFWFLAKPLHHQMQNFGSHLLADQKFFDRYFLKKILTQILQISFCQVLNFLVWFDIWEA